MFAAISEAWYFLIDHTTVISVVVSTVATCFVAFFTILLSKIGSRQADYMHVSEQAFVFPKGVFSEYLPDPANPGRYTWRLRPVWKNSGNTQTQQLTLYTDCEITNSPITASFPFKIERTPPGHGMLGPDAESLGGAAPHPPRAPITPQDALEAQQGHKFIYLWGWARYSDIFVGSKPHITRFCWLIVPDGDPMTFDPKAKPGEPGTLTFGNMHLAEGTCTDNECELLGLG